MPRMKYGIAAYYIIAPAESQLNLARYDGVGFGMRVDGKDIVDMYIKTRTEGFGDEVKRVSSSGPTSSARAITMPIICGLKVRTLIKQDYDEALKKCDVLLTPTAPDTAFKIGQNSDNPLAMYLGDVCGYVEPGWSAETQHSLRLKTACPSACSSSARPWTATLLRVAYTFEQNRTDLRKPSPMGEVEIWREI